MKSKHTFYNGYEFRSRTEARWAVYFDARNIKYEYEPEDYLTEYGRYLPDFWLPEYQVYAEVKYKEGFTMRDIRRCYDLTRMTNRGLLLLDGQPEVRSYQLLKYSIDGFFHIPAVFFDLDKRMYLQPDESVIIALTPLAHIHTARSARFEFNEEEVSHG